MNLYLRLVCFSAALVPAILAIESHAQAAPTATRALRLSAFVGANGTFTGLSSGRNAGLTAGADLSIRPYFSFEPSIEVRGTYDADAGAVDGQKNILAGLRVAKRFGLLHPYADILFGRGEIDYQNNGYPSPSGLLRYFKTVSNVLAPGAGVDVDLSPHFSLKADASFPRYTTPVTTSGHVVGSSLTGGVVYRFGFGRFPGSRR